MTINKKKKTYLLVILVFIALSILKAMQVHYREQREAISIISEWEKHGKPINAFLLDKSDLVFYTKMSGSISGSYIYSSVTTGIASKIKDNDKFFIHYDGKRVNGRVLSVGARDNRSGLHNVKLRITDDVSIPDGSIVTANVESRRIPNLICIPSVAVVRSSSETFVWLLKDGDTVTKQNIEIGLSNGAKYEVKSGLSLGDRVVTSGKTFLVEGDRVRTYKLYECPDLAQGMDDFI